ncbi:mRNA interferase MazF [Clostridium tertium]|uniref:mRNA interferase MazF n=1 Tax=Clostridium tertium TaxID=1559 RepID=A0A6N3FYH9_9CLOT
MLDFIKRGNLVMVNFGVSREGSCQRGIRPAIVVQNNAGNKHSTTTLVIPLTSKRKNKLPVHYELREDYDIALSGNIAMAEQLSVISKEQILRVGKPLSAEDIRGIDNILSVQLNLDAM